MNNSLLIGKIVKPQGIKGEVKVIPYVDDIRPFCDLKKAYMDGKAVEIVRARVTGSDVFLSLRGVADRNQAELLRGKELSLPIDEARIFNQDGYFVAELIGMDVTCDGVKLGILKEILKNGAADVFVVEGEKPFMVPFLKKLVISIDRASNTIVLDKTTFGEVVVYED